MKKDAKETLTRQQVQLILDRAKAINTTAYLADVDLGGVDLRGLDLERTNLKGTCFAGAKLAGTCLDPRAPVPEPSFQEIRRAGLQVRGDKVWGWRTEFSKYVGHTHYVPRQKPYTAKVFSVARGTECHPGIYLSGKSQFSSSWEWRGLVRCYCLRSELIHAGDEWRCKRLWVVGNKKKKAKAAKRKIR